MGIPYYFASLIRQHKGIVSKVHSCLNPDVLAIDFNCFIHQYMDDENPLESIIVALRKLLDTVCHATKHTYIAMDGMVPYAKMVQQRYRRFRIPDKTPVFDRNQISPQTPYMKELSSVVSAAFPNAILSDTSEEGEGEHKLLNWLKTLPDSQRRSVVVYGLDADLILLTLYQKSLSAPYSFNLLREDATFGKTVEGSGRACGEEAHKSPGFSTLSIWKLSDRIEMPVDEYIRMSILCFGNDFMPSLAMFSLREGGHERAVTLYKESKCSLINAEGRSKFMKFIGDREESVLMEKVSSRKNAFERAVVAIDGKYLKNRYNAHILDGVCDASPVVEAYWKTYHWTLAYFTKNVEPDWGWYYPYPDAPLVCQIKMYEEKPVVWKSTPKFTPVQQLQFILPSASLRKTKKRVVYPDEFYNEDTDVRMHWMKRYNWESKPRISLPSPTETRIEVWGVSSSQTGKPL